jgi:hypothetical protein
MDVMTLRLQPKPEAQSAGDVVAEAEEAIIACHYLASDLLDLAGRASFVDAERTRSLSIALGAWAQDLSAVLADIRRFAEDGSRR